MTANNALVTREKQTAQDNVIDILIIVVWTKLPNDIIILIKVKKSQRWTASKHSKVMFLPELSSNHSGMQRHLERNGIKNGIATIKFIYAK